MSDEIEEPDPDAGKVAFVVVAALRADGLYHTLARWGVPAGGEPRLAEDSTDARGAAALVARLAKHLREVGA